MAQHNPYLFQGLPYYTCHALGGQSTFDTENQVDTALWELAKDNWSGIPANGLKWKKAKKVEKPTGSRQIIRCHYWNTAECRWCAELVWSNETSTPHAYIRVAPRPHVNHHKTKQKRGAMSQAMAMVSSPSILQQKPACTVAKIRRAGLTITTVGAKSIKRRLSLLSQKQHTVGLENQSTGATTWGQVRQKMDTFLRENISNFNENSFYICGDNYTTNPTSQNWLLQCQRKIYY